MNRSLPILALYLFLTTTASAQEAVESVSTDGSGELRRASEAMIKPKAGSILARIPSVINKGDVIQIQYDDSGTVADSFMVTGITILGERCTIESKRTTPTGSSISDTIFAKPCRKLK